MSMRNKGYTLLEVIVTLFLTGMILLGSALAIRALGNVTSMGVNDMAYRRDMNKFAGDMENGVSSLLSCQDKSYSGFSNSGIVINKVDSLQETTLANGDIERVYNTTDITMYLKGTSQRRDLYISDEKIQENKDLSLYGFIKVIDKQINKTEFANGNIVWEEVENYNPIKIASQQFIKGKTEKTEFIITTKNDKLSLIKIKLLIPTAKGANRQFDMIFTCVQEVSVSVK